MQGRRASWHLCPLVLALAFLTAGCITPTDDPNATMGSPRPTDRWFDGTQPGEATGGDADGSPTASPTATATTTTSPSPTPSNTTSPSPTPTGTSTTSPTPEPEGETHTVEIGKNVQGAAADYAPNSITIKVGDSVVWKNLDSTAHTSTANGGHWNTGNIAGGASSDPEVFDKAGTFTYFCAYHPAMTGAEVIVEA